MRRTKKSSRGFTLVELLIGLTIGLGVLAAATYLFSKAMDATFLISQRAEMQQNGRAAMNMISRDISLAGAGLPMGGIQLPTGGVNSIYGCDQVRCYVPGSASPSGVAYPNNHLYGLIPGPGFGTPVSAGGNPTHIVTMAYVDVTFPLNQYAITAFSPGGTSITLAPPNPMPNPPVAPLNDPATGIKVGDLIMLSNSTGAAVGEATSVSATTISFSDLDPLQINQSAAASGNINALILNLPPGTTTIASRIFVITYFIDIPKGADGVLYTLDDGAPRLMRQVNGQPPVPVAENIADLQFSYDIYDDTLGAGASNLPDAGMSAGKSPNQIRKVNILSMASRSPIRGTKGFQGMDLATSVSARNMSFRDRYQ